MEDLTKAVRERMSIQKNIKDRKLPSELKGSRSVNRLSRIAKLATAMNNIRRYESSKHRRTSSSRERADNTKTGVMMTHNGSPRSVPITNRNRHFFYEQETNHRAIQNKVSYQGSQTIVAILELPVYLQSKKNPTPPQLAFFQKDGQFFDRMTLVEIDDTTIKNEGNSMTKHTALFTQCDKDSSQEKKYSIKINDIYCISSAAEDDAADINT